MTNQPTTNAKALAQDAPIDRRLFPLCHWKAMKDGVPLGKTPHKRGWQTNSYSNEEMVAWMEDGSNVGFRLGDGIGVLDYDPRNDDDKDALDRLCDVVGIDLAKCHIVETGGGGCHVYLKIPSTFAGREQIKEYPGVEFKHSPRRYVVAAGSIHPNGKPYRLRDGSPPLSDTLEAPQGLLDAYSHPSPPDGQRGVGVEGYGAFTPEQITPALSRIPVEQYSNHEEWLQFMMSFHWMTGGEGREEFVDWSTSDPQYCDHADIIRARWDSLTPKPDGIKAGFFFKALEKAGVPKSDWPVERASMLFEVDGLGIGADDLESEGALLAGVEKHGKATSYSFDALAKKIGDTPPFLDPFLYGNAGGIYVLYGAPKSGKTLIAASLVRAVANGDPEWMGRKLWLHGPVRWFALESPHSLIMSGKAWMKRTGQTHPDVRFTFDGQGFTDTKWLAEIEALCDGCVLAVIDTFTMALPGLDQNSPEAAATLYSKLKKIGEKTGTVFVVIHHSTKADGRNARGSNAIISNADGSVAVLKESNGTITFEAQAVRYGPDGGEISIAIEQEDLGPDPQRQGERMTAPYLVLADLPERYVEPLSPIDKRAEAVAQYGREVGLNRYLMTRAALRDVIGNEPSTIQDMFKRWSGPYQGEGYTLDVRKSARTHEIVVEVDWSAAKFRMNKASILFAEQGLSVEELSAVPTHH